MIVFVDAETTELDERSGHLLEVALVVTDDDLREVVAESAVVKPARWLRGHALEHAAIECDEIVYEMHYKSGLWADVDARGVGLREAERLLTDFLCYAVECNRAALGVPISKSVDSALGKTPPGGCSVSFDRRWLRHHMPVFEARFGYRSVDVSSLTELAARWAPAVYEGRPRSTDAHRALPDARGAIEILRYYRQCGFVGGGR